MNITLFKKNLNLYKLTRRSGRHCSARQGVGNFAFVCAVENDDPVNLVAVLFLSFTNEQLFIFFYLKDDSVKHFDCIYSWLRKLNYALFALFFSTSMKNPHFFRLQKQHYSLYNRRIIFDEREVSCESRAIIPIYFFSFNIAANQLINVGLFV